ncbi:MAG: hypothetical protein MI723_18370, partial [Caulobacterales bacterium]|nr:hypothetical protein [Caulobacterales bacterium]
MTRFLIALVALVALGAASGCAAAGGLDVSPAGFELNACGANPAKLRGDLNDINEGLSTVLADPQEGWAGYQRALGEKAETLNELAQTGSRTSETAEP